MYHRFELIITFKGSAMQTPEDVSNALEEVRGRIHRGRTEGDIWDVNGNSVGEWAFKTEHEDNDD